VAAGGLAWQHVVAALLDDVGIVVDVVVVFEVIVVTIVVVLKSDTRHQKCDVRSVTSEV
jgi:hypothetical protein